MHLPRRLIEAAVITFFPSPSQSKPPIASRHRSHRISAPIAIEAAHRRRVHPTIEAIVSHRAHYASACRHQSHQRHRNQSYTSHPAIEAIKYWPPLQSKPPIAVVFTPHQSYRLDIETIVIEHTMTPPSAASIDIVSSQ